MQLAKERLQPARIGYGTGVSYINVNRNIIDPKTHRWWEGPNYDGPSDKTVAVVKFETTDGEPIAVYYNYAMHAVTVGQIDKVSGDAPGAASKYIEDSFDDKIVAVWSTGAEGRPEPDLLPADVRSARDPDQGLRQARRGHQQRHASGRTGAEQAGPDGHEADEPAEADDPVDGPVPRRGSHARDARHRADLGHRTHLRGPENGQLPRPSPDEPGPRGLPRHLRGRTPGRYSRRPAADRRHRDRHGERRGVQPDRAATQGRIADRQDHDGDAGRTGRRIPATSRTTRPSATTRSKCCRRGCSPAARKARSSTGFWT